MKQKREIKVCPRCGHSKIRKRVKLHNFLCEQCHTIFKTPAARSTDVVGKFPKYLKERRSETIEVAVN